MAGWISSCKCTAIWRWTATIPPRTSASPSGRPSDRRRGTRIPSAATASRSCRWTRSLARTVLDISGRPYLVFDCAWRNERVGGLDLCMIREFFYAFSYSAGVTLHMTLLYGENDHHKGRGAVQIPSRARSGRHLGCGRAACFRRKESYADDYRLFYGQSPFGRQRARPPGRARIESALPLKRLNRRTADPARRRRVPRRGALPEGKGAVGAAPRPRRGRHAAAGHLSGDAASFRNGTGAQPHGGLGLIAGEVVSIDGHGEKIPHHRDGTA